MRRHPRTPRPAPRRIRGATPSIALIAALALTGCAPAEAPVGSGAAAPSETTEAGIDYAAVRTAPSWRIDRWLDDAYANGFGAEWRPDHEDARICGIADGVVLVASPSDSGALELRGIALDGDREVWRVDHGYCVHGGEIGDGAALILTYTDDLEQRLERLDIATGERRPLLTVDGRIDVRTVIGEHDGAVLLALRIDRGPITVMALDGGDEPRWSNSEVQAYDDCVLLDGGPGAEPDDARIGCDRYRTGYLVLDAAQGEFVVPVTFYEHERDRVGWARDGFRILPDDPVRDSATGELVAERYDLDGAPLEPGASESGPRAPGDGADLLVTLADLEAAPAAKALTPDGRVIAVLGPLARIEIVETGVAVDREHGDLLTVTRDGAVVVTDSSRGLRLLDADGAVIDEVPSRGLDLTIMGGYLVRPDSTDPAVILLPAD